MSKLPMLLALALALGLAACATPIVVTSDGALKYFKPIEWHAKDPCKTERQIAEHNSAYDTLKQGKQVVYTASCESPPTTATKAAPAKKAPA